MRSIIVTASSGCSAHVVQDVHLPEKLERRGVAPKQHVLAVVDDLAGFAIGKRRRAAAEPRPGFEHENAGAVLRQPDGRAQSGEPGADDDRVVAPGPPVLIAATATASGRSPPGEAAPRARAR